MTSWAGVAAAVVASAAICTTALAEAGAPAWGFADDATGPAKWASLSPEYAACGAGRAQSPIDLGAGDAPGKQSAVVVDYKPLPLTIHNNGHAVQVEVGNGSRITIDGKPYALLQFHFHTPSEHVVDGKRYPAEVHFVHRASDGELAVIGAFLDSAASSRALAPVVAHAPARKSSAWTYNWVTIDPAAIMPAPKSFWSYGGSLTTPPCSEGVRWMVQKMPLPMSKEHIAMLGKATGPSARPVQPINGRAVAAPR